MTEMTWGPAGRMVPEAGVYSKLPGTPAAAFSCAGLSAVPYVIADGATQINPGSPAKVVSPHPAAIRQTMARTNRAGFITLSTCQVPRHRMASAGDPLCSHLVPRNVLHAVHPFEPRGIRATRGIDLHLLDTTVLGKESFNASQCVLYGSLKVSFIAHSITSDSRHHRQFITDGLLKAFEESLSIEPTATRLRSLRISPR